MSQDIQSISERCGAVLLYHGTFLQTPKELGSGLHNVHPDTLYDHLERLTRSFTVVDLAEYVCAKKTDGLACVTFDDGYRCVLAQALPVFESLNIPLTMFVNGATVSGETFWRDAVRYLVEHKLVAEFEAYSGRVTRIPNKRFYRYSKHPSNNSAHLHADIAAFFQDRNITNGGAGYVLSTDELVAHPLVTYGNHSHHHYVMSSLAPEQQAEEIAQTDGLLKSLKSQLHLAVSDVFSIPFGDTADFNDHTLELARDFGYQAVVLSRQRVDLHNHYLCGMRAVDRMMPRAPQLDADLLDAARYLT